MRRRYAQPGFTLFEMLMVILIVPLIAGIIGFVYVTSLKLWRQTSVQEQIFPPAMLVMDRINKELRSACKVTVTSAQVSPTPAAKDSVITLYVPQVDANGYDVINSTVDAVTGTYLRTDHCVQYYLTTGGVNGSKELWRTLAATDGVTKTGQPTLIAQNMLSLQCSAAATSAGRILTLYTTTVTLSAKETGFAYRSVQDQFVSQLGFRANL